MDFNKLVKKMNKYYIAGGIRKYFSIIMYHFNRVIFQCDIPYTLDVSGVYFCHKGFNIVINPNAKFGKNITIQHGVTIGERKGLSPQIQDNCYIGARAIVIGGIIIGENSKIGAGAIVINDVPPNSIVVGNVGKIIVKEK